MHTYLLAAAFVLGSLCPMRAQNTQSEAESKYQQQIQAGHEGGDDGVKGPLAGRQRIGMAGIEHEQPATILQYKSPALDRDSGTEGVVVALYERGDIAVLVHGSQIGCVASRGRAAGRSAIRFCRIDQRGALFGIVRGQQSLDWHLGKTRVGVVAIEVAVRQLHDPRSL